GLDRRIVDLEQAFAQPRHLQRTRGPDPQVVAPEGRPVQSMEAARVVADAAARVTPVAGDAGDAGDRPNRHPSAAMALDADADANARRPRGGQLMAQLDDRLE